MGATDDERRPRGPEVSWVVEPTPEILAAIERVHAEVVRERAGTPGTYWARHPVPDWAEVEAWCRKVLPSPTPPTPAPKATAPWWPNQLGEAARVLPPAAVLKLAVGLPTQGMTSWVVQQHLGELHDATDAPDLATIAAHLRVIGRGPQEVAAMAVSGGRRSWAARWPEDDLRDFARAHPDAVLKQLAGEDRWPDEWRAALRLATLDDPLPDAVLTAISALALGSVKAHRGPAQESLAAHAQARDVLLPAIADRAADVRQAAAAWARTRPAWLDVEETVSALEAAYSRERSEPARVAQLDALEALGRPASRYLDRDALAAQARKGLAKGVTPALAWVDTAALPSIHWADTGEVVSSDVLTWLLVQAVKAKSPEPNAIQRRWCALWRADDRPLFADALLQGWLAHDQRRASPAEAAAKAHAQAVEAYWYASRGMFDDHPEIGDIGGLTVEQIAERLLPHRLGEQSQSAVDSKGVLAIVGACADGRVVADVERYAARWFGHRAAQVKALLAMLSWVEAPAAVQYVLSVGRRFRTRGIQDEAARLVAELAERKGWTVDELADRTLGTAGLDDDGRLRLDYGPRHFVASLTPQLTLHLHDADGAPVAALPEPRRSDDAELAAAAKKQLRTVKKQLDTMVKQQTARLYEAMCLQRRWRAADWSTYVLAHPIVGSLASRLLWAEVEPAPPTPLDAAATLPVVVRVLRPLGDGTVSDLDDESVQLPDDAEVVLVHDLLLDDEQRAAGAGHLADYAVPALFGQVGTQPFVLSPERRGERAILDHEGFGIRTFALRTAATRRGFTRGPAEDGGCVFRYVKRFPVAGLEAHLEFSGTLLPESDVDAALHRLVFVRVTPGEESWGADVVRLGEVPPVLLAECHRDVDLIAAAGSGFDPLWRTRQP